MTTTTIISDRMKELFIRSATIMYQESRNMAETWDVPDKPIRHRHLNQKYIVGYMLKAPHHNYNCNLDFEGIVESGDACDCERQIAMTFYIEENHRDIFKWETWSLERLITELETFNSYQLCACGSLVDENGDGWCQSCFIHRYHRTEEEGGDCCICMENEGVWMKLICKHVVHRNCYLKQNKYACPLCRAISMPHECEIHPYDI